jgi:hypothetical protein
MKPWALDSLCRKWIDNTALVDEDADCRTASQMLSAVLIVEGDVAVRTPAAYINLHSVRSDIVTDLVDFRWSSYGAAERRETASEFRVGAAIHTQSVKVYMDTARVPVCNEIDAVQLIGRDGAMQLSPGWQAPRP